MQTDNYQAAIAGGLIFFDNSPLCPTQEQFELVGEISVTGLHEQ
jgi:hypothetical protein